MGTVNDFAQGMLREYSAFAGQCAALVASPGDEATAAELFAMEDLPLIVEQLRALRARAEAAEAALAAAHAELAQARADLRVLAGLAWEGISDRFTFSPTTIGDDAAAAVDDAEDAVQGMPDADVMAAVRRALGVA